MRRLDRALIELSERGDEVGADLTLERLERSLADEPDSVIVELDLRRTEVQTMERESTATGDSGHRPHRSWLVAAAVFLAVVGVAVGLGIALSNSDEGESGVATVTDPELVDEQAVMADFLGALETGDAAAARDLVTGDTNVGPDFVGWVVALDTTGVTFDCEFEPGAVACDTTMGPDHFYERIHGQNVIKRFEARLENGFVVDPTWPVAPPEEEAERDFQAWVEETHPELAPTMIDRSSPLSVAFTVPSGEARMQLLDEYLESTEEALMADFVGALTAGDAAAARDLVTGDATVGPDFVGWAVALDTTGVAFDCEFEPGAVACDTTMGPDHFYERIHGQDVQKSFAAALANGLIVDPTWPVHRSETSAERDFRTWAEQSHPELASTMFDESPVGVLFTEESGQARMQLLDEYLASR